MTTRSACSLAIIYFLCISPLQNISAATFDVQDPHAEPMGDGQINVTGSFINDTRAFGCFIAIQCNVTTEITFIALRRNGEQRVSEVIPMPPSNYTIHAYDLEEGAQLNTWPANPDPGNVSMIQVNGASKPNKNSLCNLLATVSLTQIRSPKMRKT